MALPDQVIYATQDIQNMRHANGNPNTLGVYGEPGWTCQDWTNGNLYVYTSAGQWSLVSVGDIAIKAPILGGVRTVLLGDSITANNGGVGAPTLPTYNAIAGWFTWCNIRLGHRLQMVKNAGVAGNTTAQMIARFDTDVRPFAPSLLFVMGGTNDAVQGISSATTVANLNTICDLGNSIGATVVLMTVPPITTLDDAKRTQLETTNLQIKLMGRTRSKIVVCDIGAAIVDTTTTTFSTSWTPIAGTTSDGVHPSPTGAVLMGRILADCLAPYLVQANVLEFGNSGALNLVTQGALNGVAPNGPTGFTVNTDSATWTYPARTDGYPGTWAMASLTGYLSMAGPNVTTGFVEGQMVYATLEYTDLVYAPGEITSFYLAIYRNGANVAADPATFAQVINVPASGVLETPGYTIPAGTTALRAWLFITTSGGATKSVKLGRFAMRLGNPLG